MFKRLGLRLEAKNFQQGPFLRIVATVARCAAVQKPCRVLSERDSREMSISPSKEDVPFPVQKLIQGYACADYITGVFTSFQLPGKGFQRRWVRVGFESLGVWERECAHVQKRKYV